ncbi:MAG: tRNA1(Val) (adenine(37)-N6)-methyltransferase [Sandaracinaceae bacterium]
MDELTDDAIAGPYRILQRRRGHRYSLDDVATAATAVRARPDARSYLDLGTGIGSVLLMVAYKLAADARLAAVEAQDVSMELLRQNLSRNGLTDRVHVVHGDLRDTSLALGAPFELVTGTPPYLPPDRGTPSPDSQRTHARLEMRGGVEAYLEAAARHLAPGGRFVVCADARAKERALIGGEAAGLHARSRMDVHPRASHKGALFTVWTFAHEQGPLTIEPPLIARDSGGGRTEAAHALRELFGLPSNRAEPPSPGHAR